MHVTITTNNKRMNRFKIKTGVTPGLSAVHVLHFGAGKDTTSTPECEFCCPTLITICNLNKLLVQKKIIKNKKKTGISETHLGEMCQNLTFPPKD